MANLFGNILYFRVKTTFNFQLSCDFSAKITCSFCSFCLKTQSREVVKSEKYTSYTNKVIVSLCIMH